MRYIRWNGNAHSVRLGLLCIFACMVFFGCGRENVTFSKEDMVEPDTECISEKATEVEAKEEAAEQEEPVVVFVCGAVSHPGVYELAQDARICVAIEAAGGMTEKASFDYWNLAEVIQDGQKIYVPTKEEVEAGIVESKNETIPDTGIQDTKDKVEDKININLASEEELQTLSGIGESRAREIVIYRTEHGLFSTVDEIMNVSGIGKAIFSRMKDQITV